MVAVSVLDPALSPASPSRGWLCRQPDAGTRVLKTGGE